MTTNFRIGVALLDRPMAASGSGVFALGGQVGSFSSLNELDKASDVLWLTNIDYQTYGLKKIYKAHSNLRNDQLLRSRLDNLIKEFGMQTMPKDQQADVLSRVGQSVFNYTAALTCSPIIEQGNHTARLDWIIRQRSLPKSRFPSATDAPWISAAMQAHLFNYATAPRKGQDLIKRFYTIPRTSMARMLLARPFPSLLKAWQHVRFARPIELTVCSRLPVELEGKAAFVKATIVSLDQDRETLSPFTQRNDRNQLVSRNWIALPEALSYAADGVVLISEAHTNDLEQLTLVQPLPSSTDDSLIAAQLFAESYIYALGGKTKFDRDGQPDSRGFDALSAYLWAYEKVYMLKLAKIFHSRGLGLVTTIGSLQLQVQLPAGNIEEADALSMALGLEPPMESFQKSAMTIPPYVEARHESKNHDSARIELPQISDDQWILDSKARVPWTSFSVIKAGGSLSDLLSIDALAARQERHLETEGHHTRAMQVIGARNPRFNQLAREMN